MYSQLIASLAGRVDSNADGGRNGRQVAAVGDDFVLVGFKKAEWESRLKTS